MTTQGETREALRALVEKWREKAQRYVRGESGASEFGRCETWANCADELDAVLSTAEGQYAERDALGCALNDTGDELTAVWNVARWEPERFTPGWFMERYVAWQKRLANGQFARQPASPSAHRERGEQE